MRKSDSRKDSSSEYAYYFSDINATIEAAQASKTDGFHFEGSYNSNPKLFKTIDKLATPLAFDEVIKSNMHTPDFEKNKQKLEELRESFESRDTSTFSLADLIEYRDESQSLIEEMTKIEAREKLKKRKE